MAKSVLCISSLDLYSVEFLITDILILCDILNQRVVPIGQFNKFIPWRVIVVRRKSVISLLLFRH